MAKRRVVAWTLEWDALLGTMPDAAVGKLMGESENVVRYRRRRLAIPTYRSTALCSVTRPCANCGTMTRKRNRDVKRSRRTFCSRECADVGQKRRDSEALRYGQGWKKTRTLIRERDETCRACGKTPEQNGTELHVHHLKPYRLGGTNHPANLVALCGSCHHIAEAATSRALDAIPIGVTLDASCLTITLSGAVLWQGSVRGAGFPTLVG